VTLPTNASDPVAEPFVPATRAKRKTSWLNVLLAAAVLAAIGGVAFAAGRLTAPAAAAGRNGGFGGGGFPGGGNVRPGASGAPGGGSFPGGGFFGAGGVTIEGTVASKTADTLAITTANGQTVEISLPSTTTYHTEASATADSVQSGATVKVQVDIQRGGGQGQGQGQSQAQPGRFSASDVTVVP
jgi:hypothetical protein